MQTQLYKLLQYIGALLPSVAIALLTVIYVVWLTLRQCMAWIVGKGVRYS